MTVAAEVADTAVTAKEDTGKSKDSLNYYNLLKGSLLFIYL